MTCPGHRYGNCHSLSGGADYATKMETIHLSDVSLGSQTSFTLTIIDDDDLEPEETLFLLLSPLSPGVLINSSMAVVIILDDDGQYYTLLYICTIHWHDDNPIHAQ